MDVDQPDWAMTNGQDEESSPVLGGRATEDSGESFAAPASRMETMSDSSSQVSPSSER